MNQPTDPRAVRSREAMLAAGGALLAEEGLEAVTHQAVAARAGVGRATAYRHWPQLLDLRLAVLSASEHDLPLADAAAGTDPRAELAFHLRAIARRLHESAGAVVAAVIGGAEHDEGMQVLRERLVQPMTDALRPALTEATERGLLRSDVTAETFAMATIGPLFYQRFLLGHPLDDATVEAVVDIAWRAYAPTPIAVSGPDIEQAAKRPDEI
ncbi:MULTISPECIES: TetR/AcrR family transcriptional regulator [unclassified Kribbella]|uniref:TetR/AcrR family transcriptional regulator n=1 Tax=unclassified Kribbella TaxID=2644121 RepID=UPI0030774AE1